VAETRRNDRVEAVLILFAANEYSGLVLPAEEGFSIAYFLRRPPRTLVSVFETWRYRSTISEMGENLTMEHGLLGWTECFPGRNFQIFFSLTAGNSVVVALSLGGFEGTSDIFLQFSRDSTRQGRHDHVHLRIRDSGMEGFDEVLECGCIMA